MRIVFMGTPDFSVPVLKALIESNHKVVGVFTQPDKPKGRGNIMMMTPVKEIAMLHGIPVFQPKRLKEEGIPELIEDLKPDAIVVIAFGQILTQKVLNIPKYGCINVHASLLPKLRGAAPIQWSILNGEEKTGITTMMMDAGIDTGDMLLRAEILIEPFETGGSLHDKLSLLGAPLLLETLDLLEAGKLERTPQNHDEATYVTILKKEQGNINWSHSAIEIERFIRGLNPWPSAYTFLDGKVLKIWEADVIHQDYADFEPGTVCEVDPKKGFTVACGKGSLQIRSLQLQGKKQMDAPSFLRGVRIEVGNVFRQDSTN